MRLDNQGCTVVANPNVTNAIKLKLHVCQEKLTCTCKYCMSSILNTGLCAWLYELCILCLQIKNYFVAAGMNSSGINRSAGIGKLLAEWIVAGEPQEDIWPMDIRRFSLQQNNKRFLRERVTEVLSFHYAMPWPKLHPTSGRGLRLSPLHHQLDAAGASWGEEMGWETPNWFSGNTNGE